MGKFLRFRKEADNRADPMEALVLKERLRLLKKINVTKNSGGAMDGPRRVDGRKKTHRVGEIILEDDRRLSCLVADFSDSGMRLQLTEYGDIPDSFRLRVPTLEFDRAVTVVWRREDAVGVTYV